MLEKHSRKLKELASHEKPSPPSAPIALPTPPASPSLAPSATSIESPALPASTIYKYYHHILPFSNQQYQHFIRTTAPIQLDLSALRVQFLQNLHTLLRLPVSLFNDIDNTSPPSHFTFINKNILSPGVEPASAEWMAGCNCRKDNGRHIGCEHLSCEYVKLSEPNPEGRRYFPYSAAESNYGCLRIVYIKMRNHIHECNDMCNCDMDCKNRPVQHGRQIPLEIFKTKNRGWG